MITTTGLKITDSLRNEYSPYYSITDSPVKSFFVTAGRKIFLNFLLNPSVHRSWPKNHLPSCDTVVHPCTCDALYAERNQSGPARNYRWPVSGL